MKPSEVDRSPWYKFSIHVGGDPTMLKPRAEWRAQQLHLFHPPRRRPAWSDLSPEIQNEVVGLLAQMLRAHQRRKEQGNVEGGKVDE